MTVIHPLNSALRLSVAVTYLLFEALCCLSWRPVLFQSFGRAFLTSLRHLHSEMTRVVDD